MTKSCSTPNLRKLRWRVSPDPHSAGRLATDQVLTALHQRPDLLLCVAAGSSPAPLYSCLAERYKTHSDLFRQLRVIQVDEWLGLPANDPATCAADLEHHLVGPLRLDQDRFLKIRTDAKDPEAECERISIWLAQNGPIDLCVLGVGTNGHVAMNEPGPVLETSVHVAALTETSRSHPLLSAHTIKPSHGITLGMADLLTSKAILLLAFGRSKQPVLQRLHTGQLDPQFPVSLLHLHPEVTVHCDQASAPAGSKAQRDGASDVAP